VYRYRVRSRDFFDNHGKTLLKNYHQGSPYALLSAVYTDFDYLPWKFSPLPNNIWDDMSIRKKYIKWLLMNCDIQTESELLPRHFKENFGASLLSRYGTVENALSSIGRGKSHNNESATGKDVKRDGEAAPKNFWVSTANQRQALDEFALNIGIKDPKDLSNWYNVTAKQISAVGGRGLLARYNDSLYALLKNAYPEYEWLPWKFSRLPLRSFKDPDVQEKVVRFVEEKLKIKSTEDWHRVTMAQLNEIGLGHFFRKEGVSHVLKKFYPDFVDLREPVKQSAA